MNSLEYIELHPKIHVYKNMVPKAKEFVDFLKETETSEEKGDLFSEWEDWYIFGRYMQTELDIDPKVSSDSEYNKKQLDFTKTLSKAFFDTTNHYIEKYNIEKPDNWTTMGLSVCRYNPNNDVTEDLAMHYHTDYVGGRAEEPGFKFVITCTIYLNDEYDGGDISFLIEDTGEVIDYKPVAGDIIVFPSGAPGDYYWHGVKRISNGYKYFIRSFLGIDYPGSDQWHENVKKYGKLEWENMFHEKFKEEIQSGMWHRYIVEPGEKEKNISQSRPFFRKAKDE